MSRQLRLQVPGALFHLTARGIRRDNIYRSDNDRLTWLSLLGEACERYNLEVLAYCQMTNHFHILLETMESDLARAMRLLNGIYAQYFNRQYNLDGHVFQGRYKAILCQSELYLLELARYIELNPVRARIVAQPSDWLWSSYRATMGLCDAPKWLSSHAILAHFGNDLHEARKAYCEFVASGIDRPNPLINVSNQLVLGDEEFCASVAGNVPCGDIREIARTQRRAVALPLQVYFQIYANPKEAMAHAYFSLAYTMPQIASFAGVSVKTVSRAIQSHRA
ncbi:transposase [Pseudoduganella sp. OTU4001]|uniref:transposase n=1 Tax=Pseudoduganella sp. OTU4001 TaxID=3043854 RepID=UPI00313AFF4F